MEFLEFECIGKKEHEHERSEKESTQSTKTSEKESTQSTKTSEKESTQSTKTSEKESFRNSDGRQEFRDFNENTEKSVEIEQV